MLRKLCNFIKEKNRQSIERKQDYDALQKIFEKMEFGEREELKQFCQVIENKHLIRLKSSEKNVFIKLQKNIPLFAKYSYVASTFEGGFMVGIKNPLYQVLKEIKEDNGWY